MTNPSGDRGVLDDGAPFVPVPSTRLPVVLLWIIPLLFVVAYVLLVNTFFHDMARWTGSHVFGTSLVLLIVTFVFSLVWFGISYLAALVVGVFVPLGILLLLANVPGINRHVIVTPPTRADTPQEVWGRFGVLFVITLGFELLYMVTIFQRGDLNPAFAISRPFPFFFEEVLAGCLMALLLAPAGPFLASRTRLRITDSLELPLLWLTLLLLLIGGVSVLTVVLLPNVEFDPALFLVSVLLYAPAAWFVALAFSRSEVSAQGRFVRQAWRWRGARFHFGRLKVTDEPEGSTNEV